MVERKTCWGVNPTLLGFHVIFLAKLFQPKLRIFFSVLLFSFWLPSRLLLNPFSAGIGASAAVDNASIPVLTPALTIGFFSESGFNRTIKLPFGTDFHVLHNVCYHGGSSGIYLRKGENWPLPDSAPRIVDPNNPPWGDETPRFYNGSYYTASCYFWTEIRDIHRRRINPSHLLLKMGVVSDLADAVLSGIVQKMEFDGMLLHQCPQLEDWEWGRAVWEVSTSQWEQAGLWKLAVDSHGTRVPPMIRLDRGNTEWSCFRELFFDANNSNYFSDGAAWRKWAERMDAWIATSVAPNPFKRPAIPADRCSGGARISIYRRANGTRAFSNMEEVIAAVQLRTNNSVQFVTTHPDMTVAEQALLFSSFDVLVTPYGSHLANYILGPRVDTGPFVGDAAFAEVAPIVRYDNFQRAARRMGFRGYVISTGHKPIKSELFPDCPDDPEGAVKDCIWENGLLECPRMPMVLKHKVTNCGTIVDVPILLKHLDEAIALLCGDRAL